MNNKHMVMVANRKPYVLDLDTMTVKVTCTGIIGDSMSRFTCVRDNGIVSMFWDLR